MTGDRYADIVIGVVALTIFALGFGLGAIMTAAMR